MTGCFQERLPTLSDAALRAYLERPGDYRPDAVRAAAEELRRRGMGPTEAGWQALEAALAPPPHRGPEPRHLRELEVFGGKANILATQFRQWFEGLWEGRNLAWTVATLSAALAGGLRPLGRARRA